MSCLAKWSHRFTKPPFPELGSNKMKYLQLHASAKTNDNSASGDKHSCQPS